MPKAIVVTDHQIGHAKLPFQYPLHKLVGGELRHFLIEIQQNATVDTRLLQHRELLFGCGKQGGDKMWLHHLPRMLLESDHQRGEIFAVSSLLNILNQKAMAAVNAIEEADRSHCGHVDRSVFFEC